MQRKWRAWPFIAGVGAVMGYISSVRPEDAASNLAAWLQTFGVDNVPLFLRSEVADTVTLGVGITITAAALGYGLVGRYPLWRRIEPRVGRFQGGGRMVTAIIILLVSVAGVMFASALLREALLIRAVDGHLIPEDLVVYSDLVQPPIMPAKLEKIQLGVQLTNSSTKPIEYVGEDFSTSVAGHTPTKLDWTNYAVIRPGEHKRFMDFPIDLGGIPAGTIKGDFMFVFSYGPVGRRCCRLPLRGTIEVFFDPATGAYQGHRVYWDDKFRYGTR